MKEPSSRPRAAFAQVPTDTAAASDAPTELDPDPRAKGQPVSANELAPTIPRVLVDGAADPTGNTLLANVDSSADTLLARREEEERIPPPPESAQRLSRFVLLDQLGSGGMGTVYAAWDSKLERRVALKVLRAEAFQSSFEGRRLLLAEARAMARLAHPNVVGLHDVLEDDGQVMLAMEFIDGGNMRSWLRTKPSVDQILDVLMEAGRGLAAAHAQNILHRDFKPDNVLIGRDGRARVSDFGIAAHARAAPGNVSEDRGPSSVAMPTTVTTLAGTMGYIAPEALRREPVSAMADQFSFCVSAWEALTGKLPPEKPGLQPLSGMLPGIRAALVRGMSDDPKTRFPHMDALLQAFIHARGSRKRWFQRAALAVVSLALLTGGGYAWRQEALACVEGEQLMAQAWGPERRAKVNQALEQKGVENAAVLRDDMNTRVSARAEAWRQGYASTCQAMRRADPIQRPLLGAQLACFQRRLRTLGAVTERWAGADAQRLSRTATQIDGLVELDDCPAGTTGGYVRLPDDPNQAAEAQVLRSEMEGLSARYLTMSNDEGEALLGDLRRVGERAAKAEDHWSAAAARNMQSRIQCERGDQPAACIETLQIAASESLSANDTGQALKALSSLAREQAKLGRADEAHFLSKLANALLDQAGRPLHLRAEYHINIGSMLSALTDYRAAEENLGKAWSERVAIFGSDSLEVAQNANNLGVALHNLRRYNEAEQRFKEALAIRTKRLGPKHSSRLVLLFNLGCLYRDLDRVTDALSIFDEALTQIPDKDGKPHPRRRVFQYNRGIALLDLSRIDEAEAALRESIAQTEAAFGADSAELAAPLALSVEIALARGINTPEVLQTAARAVRLAETKGKTGYPLGRVLLVQARVMASTDPEQARALLQRARSVVPDGIPLALSDQRHQAQLQAALEGR